MKATKELNNNVKEVLGSLIQSLILLNKLIEDLNSNPLLIYSIQDNSRMCALQKNVEDIKHKYERAIASRVKTLDLISSLITIFGSCHDLQRYDKTYLVVPTKYILPSLTTFNEILIYLDSYSVHYFYGAEGYVRLKSEAEKLGFKQVLKDKLNTSDMDLYYLVR